MREIVKDLEFAAEGEEDWAITEMEYRKNRFGGGDDNLNFEHLLVLGCCWISIWRYLQAVRNESLEFRIEDRNRDKNLGAICNVIHSLHKYLFSVY